MENLEKSKDFEPFRQVHSDKTTNAVSELFQDYEEDDLLSFANPNYSGTGEEYSDDHEDLPYEQEFDHLLPQDANGHFCLPDSFTRIGYDEGVPSREKIFMDEPEETDPVDEGAKEGIYKALDEFYVKIEKNGKDGRENVKRRQKYASLGIDDMGMTDEQNGQKDVLSSPRFSEPSSPSTGSGRDEYLPHGWEKHEDDDGPYYWHIRTGTIQRNPPEGSTSDSEHSVFEFPALQEPTDWPASSSPNQSESRDEPKRFSVRSLGWTEIDEESLTPEKSSRAVNKCILDLSAGRNDTLDSIGRWGDGKDIFLELYPDRLCLVDAVDSVALHTQPIQTIRVWGVGRDDSRDFAFVARDLQTNIYKCHVLRCDIPARRIAHALKEVCQEYIAQHDTSRADNDRAPKRPHTLSLGRRRNSLLASSNIFPTPIEEPKKVFRVLYMGRRPVKVGVGIEVLHGVIDQMLAECPEEEWIPVSVAVSPSTITIVTQEDEPEVMAECRVRYLTFLGIGRDDIRTCGFIVHTPEDTFLVHVFACSPSGGPLCKAIEAACKLRYQKFLDAHTKAMEEAQNRRIVTPTEKIGAKLRSFFGAVSSHLRTS
ncbi:protein Fe65 homolog isoform X2 [Paramacrobiotus metropolitanus]|uniref:protein Fe65 homolog isoform X2 n=1 Tax=Paramacrobiotus metropolitanus TaxID=2943436 RepID=UPI0024464566|nr:protein Fe65 homolog isoform X2 [Paramacrobiotus metropolitanus]